MYRHMVVTKTLALIRYWDAFAGIAHTLFKYFNIAVS